MSDWHSESSYIIFRDEVIRRILSGEKRELRHTRWMEGVNSSPWFDKISDHEVSQEKGLVLFYASGFTPVAAVKLAFHPGQELFTREPWMQVSKEKFIRYKADGAVIDYRGETPRALSVEEAAQFPQLGKGWKYINPFRMPKEFTRLRLSITDVCVQRLHQITPEEAENEGALLDEYRIQTGNLALAHGKGISRKQRMATRTVVYKSSDYPDLPQSVARFAALWESINGTEPTTSWSHNPYTWRIQFVIKSKLP